MANDALDPGPNGDYPFWPRLADGSPDPERMPRGLVWQQGLDGDWLLIDLTQRDEAGAEIIPPKLGGTP